MCSVTLSRASMNPNNPNPHISRVKYRKYFPNYFHNRDESPDQCCIPPLLNCLPINVDTFPWPALLTYLNICPSLLDLTRRPGIYNLIILFHILRCTLIISFLPVRPFEDMPSGFLPRFIGFVAFIFLGSAMLHFTKLLQASMESVDSEYNCTAGRKGCGGYGGSVNLSDHPL